MPGADRLTPLPVTFRPVRTRLVLLSVGFAVLVTFTTVALLMPPPYAAAARVEMPPAGLLICALMVLLSRPKVVAAPDGVTVVNLLVKRRLAWAEVLGVHLRSGDPWVYLDLADGTSMAAMGIQPGNGKRLARRDAARLRDLAEAYGTGHPDA
ncbi:PH domain-containing protein [Streptomyces sp. SL13]|uniref:PH domain-containing protein n=1 Tax=Streptantibioticus silvisoli TaxID=2705255 RepID=A0AA90H5B3_9ACTN|nr:PH domain-containing protein [Streptantibioticus silvisoli]MDI5964741.1 PH domain-containing protein [Streptantibioticus silvisoli]MDI5972216.1 PH domain-containing protein [Streptantibioticus silvisoli]